MSIYFPFKRETKEVGVHSLYDHNGKRKYLISRERAAFLKAARNQNPEIETFCLILCYSGARISEVLALTPDRVDFGSCVIIFETLKRRRKGTFRAVPVPEDVLRCLADVHCLNGVQMGSDGQTNKRLWPWCRTTAWQHVKTVMAEAGISGPQACPKGLRHAFAVLSLQSGVPINLVSRWLGHSRLETTAIYAEAIGDEEKAIAERFWQTFE